jgi:hypothetical protein
MFKNGFWIPNMGFRNHEADDEKNLKISIHMMCRGGGDSVMK